MFEAKVIDYEALLAEYQHGMVTRLRGFGPAVAFLEQWVPDGDPHKSLSDLLEVAGEAGETALTLLLSAALVQQAGEQQLLELLQEFGGGALIQAGSLWRLELDRLVPPARATQASAPRARTARGAPAPELEAVQNQHPTLPGLVRVKALSAPYHRVVPPLERRFEHPPRQPRAGRLLVRSSVLGLSLSLELDARTHTIADASYDGDASPIEAALLEVLCALVKGLPAQEASDHAVMRVEFRLRDKEMPCPEPRFDARGLQVAAIEFDVRIVMSFAASFPIQARAGCLVRLEDLVKARIDERLELFQEELKDHNALRRLSERGSSIPERQA